jgi:hypothetical protein
MIPFLRSDSQYFIIFLSQYILHAPPNPLVSNESHLFLDRALEHEWTTVTLPLFFVCDRSVSKVHIS